MRVSLLTSDSARLPLLLGLIGCLITALCGYQIKAHHHRDEVERFQNLADTMVKQVAQRIQPYEDGLRETRAVVIGAGGPSITRNTFQHYISTRDIKTEFPGLVGFGFIRIITPKNESTFVKKIRTEGFSDFKINQLVPHKEDRYVIEYIEPLTNNRSAMGLDIASEPKRKQAAQAAMIANQTTITEPITLVQADSKKNSGFLMLLPVYLTTDKIKTNSKKQATKGFGWVYAPLVIDEILQGINIDQRIGFVIEDAKTAQPFYNAHGDNIKSIHAFEYIKTLNIAQREWRFRFIALPAFENQGHLPQFYLIIMAMLLATLIISGFFYQLLKSRERNLQIRIDQKKRNRLRTIMDAVPCGILMMDSSGRIREVNEGLCVMLGYDRASLLEQSLKTILPARYIQNRPQLIIELLQQARDQPDGANIVFKAMCQNGAELPVSVDFKPMHDGKEFTIIASWTDISERRKQERQLREYSELQRAILTNAGYAIIATDANGIITVFNPAAESMSGYSAAEMIGKASPSILHDSEEVVERAQALSIELQRAIPVGFETLVAKTKDAITKLGFADVHEWTYIRKDGSRFPVLLTTSCLLQENGDILGYLGVAADLTEQKGVEEKCLLAAEAAEAAARTKSEFLANMSHEIRTPMNGIIGMTAITLETQLTPVQREYLTLVQDSANYLLQLINDILDFSKMESGKLQLSPIDFHVREMLKKRLPVLEQMAKQKNLQLLVELDESVPNWLHGDPDRWIQIIINFVSNAIKFTSQGNVRVVLKIAQPTDHIPNPNDSKVMLHCNVIDTGIGIPLSAQQRIFEAFSQADASTTRRYGGTGLGLSICRQIAELMGGKIWVESQPGVGSQFQLLIPFDIALSVEEKIESLCAVNPAVSVNTSSKALNVLLAEDHPVNQKIVIEILKNRGHHVTLAENGNQALDRYAEDIFDLILMDVQMPGMDGETATTAIRLLERETGTHVRIIGLTAHALVGDKERLLKIGMDGYLSKPFMPQELIQLVEHNLSNHRHEESSITPNPDKIIQEKTHSEKTELEETNQEDEAPSLMIFNRQEALERAMGEISFLKTLSSVFIESLPDMRNELQQAFDREDDAAVARAAHRIKGSVANFSSPVCVDIAKKVETAAECADWPAITQLMQQWDQQVEQLVRLLKELD